MSSILEILENLPDEIKMIVDDLSPTEVEVANCHLRKMSTRQIIKYCGIKTGSPTRDYHKVKTILHKAEVKEYISLVKDYSCSSTIANLHEIDIALTETFRTSLHEVMGWRSEPIYEEKWDDDDDPELDEPERVLIGYRTMPYLLPMDQLTERQKRFIKSIKIGKNGLEVETRDPDKAADMLIRRQGGYTDNINSSVKGEIESTVHIFAHMPNNNRGPRKEEG